MRNVSPRRGLHNMRSRTTRRATASQTSPELYLKLTSLEIERSRRVTEFDNLSERLRSLAERIRTISEEQVELRLRLEGSHPGLAISQTSPTKQNNNVGFTY